MKKEIKKNESLFGTTHMKITTICCCLIAFGLFHNISCIVLMPDGKESALSKNDFSSNFNLNFCKIFKKRFIIFVAGRSTFDYKKPM